VNYLLDTNVISELRKGPGCNPFVGAWYATLDDRQTYLSVLVLGEIRRGVEKARRTDPERARRFVAWLETLRGRYADWVLPIDERVADEWGRLTLVQPSHVTDVLLAATAMVNSMTLATRNLRHVAGLGIAVVNPFDPAALPP
jgi:predicted nucleic acid-binding protein